MRIIILFFSLYILFLTSISYAYDFKRSVAKTRQNSEAQYIDIINGNVYKNGKRIEDQTIQEVLKNTKTKRNQKIYREVNIDSSHLDAGGTRKSRFGDKIISGIRAAKNSPKYIRKQNTAISIGYKTDRKIRSKEVNNTVTIKNSTTNLGTGVDTGVKANGLAKGAIINNKVIIEKSYVQ